MQTVHLSIIIPVYDQWPLTEACLESLARTTPGRFCEVLVVDNGSTDDTPQACPVLGEALFGDRFRYLRNASNNNFGPACNQGAEAAGGEYLFFLNNDTLATPNWFGPLLEAFKRDPRLAAVSPLCLFPDTDRVQHLGIGFDGGLSVKHPYFLFPGDHPVVRSRRPLQALSAAALMLPARLFREAGGFYPEYANGFEDIDLCCRLRRKGGRLALESRSRIVHLTSQTPGRNRADAQNIALVNQRCSGCFVPDVHTLAAADGFVCELTPWLDLVLRHGDELPLAELNSLDDPHAMEDGLRRYPFWEAGYDRLAALRVAAGDFEAARDCLVCGAHFFPGEVRLADLRDVALLCGDTATAQSSAAKAASIKRIVADTVGTRERAASILSWAEDNGDELLVSLYRDWLLKI